MGGAIISAAIAAGASAASAKAAQKEAKRQRQHIDRLSRTSYQRQRRDLERAGYNPLLALGGGGATSPPGGIAQVPDYAQSIAAGARTGLEAFRNKEEVKNLKEANKLLIAQTGKAGVEAETTKTQGDLNIVNSQLADQLREKAAADTVASTNTANKIATEQALMLTDLPGKRAIETMDNTKAGEILRWVDRTIKSLSPFIPSNSARGGRKR